MSYQHLLVPVDRNDPDRGALDAALEIALQHDARTTLIYVIEAIDPGAEDQSDEFASFYADVEVGVRQQLDDLTRPFQQAGLTVDTEIVVGHGPREIVQYSATGAVDLIVMRSQKIDLSRPYENLTSMSYQVSLFCQCPVMLVK